MSTVIKKTDVPVMLDPGKVKVPPGMENITAGQLGITDMKVDLQTTQINQPSVEFPTDEVILHIEINNTGHTDIPKDVSFTLLVYRNEELLRNIPFTFTTKWVYILTDRFTHNLPVEYKAMINADIPGWTNPKFHTRSVVVNEMLLHPGGNPEFTIAMFDVKRIWQQSGNKFVGHHRFSANLTNTGNGYSTSDTQLAFTTDTGNIISLPLKANTLPGPGSHKRFAVDVENEIIPTGNKLVKAKVDPVTTETNKNNNISSNAVAINNSLFPAMNELFDLKLEPGSEHKKIRFTCRIQNRDMQFYRNLKLLLFKDDIVIKEWAPLGFAPFGASHTVFTEEVSRPEGVINADQYKLVISTGNSATPPADSYLAISMLKLFRVELDADQLKILVADTMAKKIKEFDSSVIVNPADVKFELFTSHILLTLKGKKVQDVKDADFTIRMKFYPDVADGKIELNLLDEPAVDVDMGWLDWVGRFLLPGIYDLIKLGITEIIENKFPESFTLAGNDLPMTPVSTALFDNKIVIVTLTR